MEMIGVFQDCIFTLLIIFKSELFMEKTFNISDEKYKSQQLIYTRTLKIILQYTIIIM